MVFLIIIPFLNGYFIGNINPTFSGPNPFGSNKQYGGVLPTQPDFTGDLHHLLLSWKEFGPAMEAAARFCLIGP